MEKDLWAGLINLGAVGALLWWMTSFLVPKLMGQLASSIEVFQKEMEAERAMHREINQRILEKHDKAIDGLLGHMLSDH